MFSGVKNGNTSIKSRKRGIDLIVVFSIAGVEIPSEDLEKYPLYSPVIDEVCCAVKKRLQGN